MKVERVEFTKTDGKIITIPLSALRNAIIEEKEEHWWIRFMGPSCPVSFEVAENPHEKLRE